MINFPVLDRLDISGYGLFPGTEQDPGLHVRLQPGLTLVLGANGLGKTTLVTIMYRMLSGPFDIPGLETKADLGNIRLTPTALTHTAKSLFSARVVDGARNATAALTLRLGGHAVRVERRLSDLRLVRFTLNDEDQDLEEVKSFQETILKLVGVWSFGDWILLLRHLVFYFEDRRALVWDASAQRQVLRMLFLPPETARRWTEEERSILELDSRMRNLSATLYREERALAANEVKVRAGADVGRELRELEPLQKSATETLQALEDEILELENARQEARLRLLKAEQEREAQQRSIERARIQAIEASFPDQTESTRYILAHLMSEATCLVCGSRTPEAAKAYAARIDQTRCVVCNSDLSGKSRQMLDTASERVLADAAKTLERLEASVDESRRSLDESDTRYRGHLARMTALGVEINERSALIDSLIKRLPPEEADMHKQRTELASLRSKLEGLRRDLVSKREAFQGFVQEITRDLVQWSDVIKKAFDEYAEGFLFEMCHLVWSPQKATLGQGGTAFAFPAFELDLTGTNFPSAVRRSGPEQVSESQREFIDLAFRMALIRVAGSESTGTLVIDAPESSLDAVFAPRAAHVLARFAESTPSNRLFVTSNLVEGQLIPGLIGDLTSAADRRSRVVDLVSIAAPTAAVRQLAGEYAKVRDNLLSTGSDQ